MLEVSCSGAIEKYINCVGQDIKTSQKTQTYQLVNAKGLYWDEHT